MTLQEWEQEKDRELDEQMTALFRSVDPPAPRSGFVSRTMKAVRRAPLPKGRRPIHIPWTVAAGWAALVAAGAAVSYALLADQPFVAEAFASLAALAVHAAMTCVQAIHASSTVFDLFATMSRVASRVLSTRAGAGGLISMTFVAAVSFSMLHKLLLSDKESSSW
jgi:uncharacterized membrane protein